MVKNLLFLLALQSVDGLGPIRLKHLLDNTPDFKQAWELKSAQLRELHIPQNVIFSLEEKRKSLDPEKYLDSIKRSGIKVMTIYDSDYPKLLKEIYDPPIILFYRGEILPSDQSAIGVVGTRKITGYGKTVTEKITKELVSVGLTIVSGLARGVDTLAHQTALENKGRTVAVLGGGLNLVFPPENQRLAKEISNGYGAVLSEYPPDYPHLSGNFPGRNRIISGLSLGVVITEAAQDSGSLITAKYALEQGREVFAIPGPVTSSLSEGPTMLLKNGARLVTKGQDITEELGFVFKAKPSSLSNIKLSSLQGLILESLKEEAKHVDEICRELNKNPAEVSAELIKMEITGIIKSLGGGVYAAF